jgi:hypothetical protein
LFKKLTLSLLASTILLFSATQLSATGKSVDNPVDNKSIEFIVSMTKNEWHCPSKTFSGYDMSDKRIVPFMIFSSPVTGKQHLYVAFPANDLIVDIEQTFNKNNTHVINQCINGLGYMSTIDQLHNIKRMKISPQDQNSKTEEAPKEDDSKL